MKVFLFLVLSLFHVDLGKIRIFHISYMNMLNSKHDRAFRESGLWMTF